MDNLFLAFALTTLAGLCTGIGSAIAFFTRQTSKRFLSISLGFSAGVMIYVSMLEILPKAQNALTAFMAPRPGALLTIAAFFSGMLLTGVIDRLIPEEKNPHEPTSAVEGEDFTPPATDSRRLMRTGLFTALAITIHNFPEGMATFVSALQEPSIAIPIVAAIAIHNIPEGVAVSVPIYYATGSKKKAFIYSFASGLAEPVGALAGFLLLLPFINELLLGLIMAMVAGIMVFIAFDELLPAAREYGQHHLSLYGLLAGMLVMAISLALFV